MSSYSAAFQEGGRHSSPPIIMEGNGAKGEVILTLNYVPLEGFSNPNFWPKGTLGALLQVVIKDSVLLDPHNSGKISLITTTLRSLGDKSLPQNGAQELANNQQQKGSRHGFPTSQQSSLLRLEMCLLWTSTQNPSFWTPGIPGDTELPFDIKIFT